MYIEYISVVDVTGNRNLVLCLFMCTWRGTCLLKLNEYVLKGFMSFLGLKFTDNKNVDPIGFISPDNQFQFQFDPGHIRLKFCRLQLVRERTSSGETETETTQSASQSREHLIKPRDILYSGVIVYRVQINISPLLHTDCGDWQFKAAARSQENTRDVCVSENNLKNCLYTQSVIIFQCTLVAVF